MINSTVCYLQDGNQTLLMYRNRKKNDPNAGKWIGIGGKFIEGESPRECARREIFEETGLFPSTLCFRGVVTFISDRYETEQMFLFTGTADSTLPLPDCREGELHWVDTALLDTLPTWEGDRRFLPLLQTDRCGFLLSLRYEGDRLIAAEMEG